MFKTARMRKLKIISLNQYAQSIVETLHEESVVQISDISDRIQHDPEWQELLEPSKITPITGRLSSLLMKASGISELLGDALSGETKIMDLLKSFISTEAPRKIEVEDIDAEELIEKAENLLDQVESKTKVIENQRNALMSRASELESNIKVASKMSKLNLDLATLNDTKYTSTIACGISAESAAKFKEESVKITDKLLFLEEPNDADDNDEFDEILIVITLNEYKDEINGLLRKFNFEKYEVKGLSGTPSEIITSSENELKSIEEEEKNLDSQLKEIAEEWDDDILVLKEQLEIERDRNEIFATFGKTENTVLLEAWVPLKDVEKAKAIIENETDGHCEIEVEDVGEDDSDVPVLQNNPWIAKPYEYLIAMYAPPRYNELDPTIFMALFFPFMFGFCLTDAFYAIIITAIALLAVRGIGRFNKTFHSLGWIMVHCGIWGMILGFVADGFLGDFTLRFLSIPLPTTLIDAFHLPHIVLIYAVLVGVLMINIATLMGAIDKFRYNDVKGAVTKNLVWFIFEIGLVFIALSVVIPALGTIGLIIGGVCVLITIGLLVYGEGAFGMMNIFTFIGNILSYARLLAMCLSTAGIAITANILAQVVYGAIPIEIIAWIFGIATFTFGHIMNIFIQIVGGFINTMRLHFVEFFSHFYIGGRQAFTPFSSNREITKLKK